MNLQTTISEFQVQDPPGGFPLPWQGAAVVTVPKHSNGCEELKNEMEREVVNPRGSSLKERTLDQRL